MRAALIYLVLSAFLLDWFRKSMDLIVSNWIKTMDTDSTAITLRLISKTVYDWMIVPMLAASEHSKQYLNFCCAWILVVICGDNYNNPFRGMKTMWSTSRQLRSLIVHEVTDEVNTIFSTAMTGKRLLIADTLTLEVSFFVWFWLYDKCSLTSISAVVANSKDS